jgi:hypothetical protein
MRTEKEIKNVLEDEKRKQNILYDDIHQGWIEALEWVLKNG